MTTLSQLPTKVRNYWQKTYNQAKKYVDESSAEDIAWHRLSTMVYHTDDIWVARIKNSEEVVKEKFYFSATNDSVSRSDGYVYRDYVLTSKKDVFSDFAFKRMTEQINEQGLKGRIDEHKLYHYLKHQKGLTEEEIEEELQRLETGLEAVKASYDGEQLVATIKMTPEVYEEAKDFVGASIEARMPLASFKEGVYHQARLLGFTLTNEPHNPDAVVVS